MKYFLILLIGIFMGYYWFGYLYNSNVTRVAGSSYLTCMSVAKEYKTDFSNAMHIERSCWETAWKQAEIK